ncbi:MAG: outer membrane protein transport protein, partial [Mariprofundaceae bacterium]|nr:outer membrane protein transport protein [Mariprofundaceae bacterium]
MKRSWMMLLIGAGMLPAGFFYAQQAQAAAMASLDLSAAAVGAGNAFTASADDPSAMHFNPAGLAWQPGFNAQFSGAARFENMSVQQTAARGTPFNTRKPGSLVGVYGGWMPADSNWGLGFSIDRPYVLNSGWGTAFGGAAQRTSFDALHGGLNAVYAVSSSLAVSLGGDLYSAKGDVNSTATTFHGKDRASFGGNVSVLWHPRPAWGVGAMLKSGSTIKLSGTAVGAVSGSASVKVKLPDVARIGVMHVINDKYRIEVDTSWTRW